MIVAVKDAERKEIEPKGRKEGSIWAGILMVLEEVPTVANVALSKTIHLEPVVIAGIVEPKDSSNRGLINDEKWVLGPMDLEETPFVMNAKDKKKILYMATAMHARTQKSVKDMLITDQMMTLSKDIEKKSMTKANSTQFIGIRKTFDSLLIEQSKTESSLSSHVLFAEKLG